MAAKIVLRTGLQATGLEYQGWIGIDCLRVPAAVWMMRLLVASNVLTRREGTAYAVRAGELSRLAR